MDAGPPDPLLAADTSPVLSGTTVTFLWRGKADSVRIRCARPGLPAEREFRRIEGTDGWMLEWELPRGSRVEYRLAIERRGRTEETLDPAIPRRARNPFGESSVCHGPGYETPDWARPDPEAAPGTVEEIVVPSRALRRDERVRVYRPAGFRRRIRLPLLVVHDGFEFLEYAGMRVVLDNLIHRGELAPIVVAFVHPGERLVEYADHRPHARFLADELLPELSRRWPVRRRWTSRALMGASFGAVASLAAAWRNPGTFGGLLLLSGSFPKSEGARERGPEFAPVVRFLSRFRESPGRFAKRAYVACGLHESLIPGNRELVKHLEGRKLGVRYTESRDGHDWHNWRDRLGEGLPWLFGSAGVRS